MTHEPSCPCEPCATARLRDLLRRCLPIVETAAEPEHMYGFFPGGDPRDFRPDEECSTEEEQAQWKADCEKAAATGEEQPSSGQVLRDDAGNFVGHIQRSGYGLGTYTMRNPEAEALLADLRAALEAKC